MSGNSVYKEVLFVREKFFLMVNKGCVFFVDWRFFEIYGIILGFCEWGLVEVMCSNFEFGGIYKGRLVFLYVCS